MNYKLVVIKKKGEVIIQVALPISKKKRFKFICALFSQRMGISIMFESNQKSPIQGFKKNKLLHGTSVGAGSLSGTQQTNKQ